MSIFFTHKLAVVQTLIAAGKVRITKSALFGVEALGFDFDDVLGVV